MGVGCVTRLRASLAYRIRYRAALLIIWPTPLCPIRSGATSTHQILSASMTSCSHFRASHSEYACFCPTHTEDLPLYQTLTCKGHRFLRLPTTEEIVKAPPSKASSIRIQGNKRDHQTNLKPVFPDRLSDGAEHSCNRIRFGMTHIRSLLELHLTRAGNPLAELHQSYVYRV